ncbi:MAG: DnaJ domain-containing protein [Acidobacteria bacterium]|nr:DnaJ domain-containing protein [Acidobacteriota bacterium]
MVVQNALDVKGNLRDYPLAELIVEIAQSQLSGSLRLEREAKKVIIYFRDGRVIFAVSNAREHRLFHFLIEQKKLPTESLAKYPGVANDMELAAALVRDGAMDKKAVDDAMRDVVRNILIDCLLLTDGEWHFSPLARLREDIDYDVNIHPTLMDYARCVPLATVEQRFKSVSEAFCSARQLTTNDQLLPHEAFVHSNFNGADMKIEDLRKLGGMPEQGLLQGLYILWLGGFLLRKEWNAAFSSAKIKSIQDAKLARVKEAPKAADEPATAQKTDEATAVAEPEEKQKIPQIELSLDEYLERAENAPTFYEVLGLGKEADATAVKSAYFGLAKLFHPDRYHKAETSTLRRIQVAFTNLAHAYETLKNAESRSAYDFKVRKELEMMEERRASGKTEAEQEADVTAISSWESFDQGMKALADDDYDAAATMLARAVHYSPDNALYRAYYGHALSANDRMRHKAEAELQAAVKLDPVDWKVRSLLVEFFEDMDMTKRAIGELKRYLEVVPNSTEAARILNRLSQQ